MVKINAERLLSDLNELRSFGSCGTGVIRTSFSKTDIESRKWLLDKFKQASLDPCIDGVGNVIGYSRNKGKALLLGSHTDTTPQGGWLDGSLGVMYALETVRVFQEETHMRNMAIDVASWMDEEGAFTGCLGSRSFCNKITPNILSNAKDSNGLLLSDAICAAKLDSIQAEHIDHSRYLAYMEAHIEQGPRLESEKKQIGVVTAIIGVRGYKIIFTGEQNHAGTTSMSLRKDAGTALIRLAYEIHKTFSEIAIESTVWTIGDVRFEPGDPSVIPGRTDMLLQIRDLDTTVLDRMEAALYGSVHSASKHGPVKIEVKQTDDHILPVLMDKKLQEHMKYAAELDASGKWVSMPSGAGHDAMIFADFLPTAMLFIPSIGGISHSFAEDSKKEDIILGCQVFVDTAISILKGI